LQRLKVEVLVVDRDYEQLKNARMLGLDVFYGEFLSEHAEDTMEVQHLSYLLCATDNDSYNALVCKGQGRRLGHHRTFQVAIHYLHDKDSRRVPLQTRGYFAFNDEATIHALNGRLQEGWSIQTSNLTYAWGWNEFSERLGALGKDWWLLGGIAPGGAFRIYSSEQPFKLDAGWTAIYFAPPRERTASVRDDAATS